ncbi:MAG: hypothetical protein KC593_07175 [Myxococcales bacterium]|nr:hypothetical protein [Myxococcales bacterium]
MSRETDRHAAGSAPAGARATEHGDARGPEDRVMRALLGLVSQADPWPTDGPALREAQRALAADVTAVSQAYTRERHAIDQGATGEAAYRARRRFFLPRDGAKVVKPLLELWAAGALPPGPRWRVLDLGAGLGSTSLGVAATLSLLAAPGEDALVRELHVDAVEKDPGALRHFSQLARHAEASGLPRVSVRPLAVDLRQHALEGPYDLIVAGLVLNELLGEPALQAAARLAGLVQQLAPGGSLIVLEPALREPTRALHEARDALTAHPHVRIFGPCVHAGPCPMLQGPKDWCHEDVPATLPDELVTVARDAGLRFERLTYAFLTLRRADENVSALVPEGEGQALRVVSQPLPTKGKREWFACGEHGRVRVTRLDRHQSDVNAGFERAQRGDLVRLPVLDTASRPMSDARVRADTPLPGWFYAEQGPRG